MTTAAMPNAPMSTARVTAKTPIWTSLSAKVLPSMYFTKTRVDPIEHGFYKAEKAEPDWKDHELKSSQLGH